MDDSKWTGQSNSSCREGPFNSQKIKKKVLVCKFIEIMLFLYYLLLLARCPHSPSSPLGRFAFK